MKIIDKINQVLQSDSETNKTCYSFEYFPPRTEQGMQEIFVYDEF